MGSKKGEYKRRDKSAAHPEGHRAVDFECHYKAYMEEGEKAGDKSKTHKGEEDYTAKKEKPGEDKRKGAEKRGAEATKKKTSGKGRGEKKGDDAYVNEALEEIVNEVTDRVAKRLVKENLKRKLAKRLAQ